MEADHGILNIYQPFETNVALMALSLDAVLNRYQTDVTDVILVSDLCQFRISCCLGLCQKMFIHCVLTCKHYGNKVIIIIINVPVKFSEIL